jgi:hypothetical protein
MRGRKRAQTAELSPFKGSKRWSPDKFRAECVTMTQRVGLAAPIGLIVEYLRLLRLISHPPAFFVVFELIFVGLSVSTAI